MAQRLVDAQYEYNWNPLVGSLAGALRALERPAGAAAISVLTGAAGAPPAVERDAADGVWFAPRRSRLELPAALSGGLRALGAAASVTQRQAGLDRWRWRPLRWALRRELGRGRPIVAAGAGVDPFGPPFGLIVGFDDTRRAWRRDGPMTEQVGAWLREDELRRAAPLVLIRLRPAAPGGAEAVRRAALEAAADQSAAAAAARWIAVLESGDPIEPQGHARAAQTFAAARGEAAGFWRGLDAASPQAKAAQRLALTLSRFATLFPYPMGGAPNARGVRSAGAAILRQALAELQSSA